MNINIGNYYGEALHQIGKSRSTSAKVKVIDHIQFKSPYHTYEKQAFMVLFSYK